MTFKSAAAVLLFAVSALAQSKPTLATFYDGQLSNVEKELVPLAEAMPANAYNFAPTNGTFDTVRTFALQARHIATVIYEVSAASMKETCPVALGKNENGADELKSKEQIVKYLKDAFAYGHKAAKAMTAENQLEMLKSPFSAGEIPRASLVSICVWHSYDHYGQMVVYARMNKTIPPASK